MKSKQINSKTDLVAYCGLYCGDCFSFKGTIADLSRDLRKELRQAKFSDIAKGIPFKEFKKYKECYECLGAMVRLRCKSACKGGGGNPFCDIRKCCQKKEFDGCWECDEIETCKKLNTLNEIHKDAHRKNLQTIKKKGISEFIKGKKWF
jgi:hypothetical protein